jgi:hypothetical protein
MHKEYWPVLFKSQYFLAIIIYFYIQYYNFIAFMIFAGKNGVLPILDMILNMELLMEGSKPVSKPHHSLFDRETLAPLARRFTHIFKIAAGAIAGSAAASLVIVTAMHFEDNPNATPMILTGVASTFGSLAVIADGAYHLLSMPRADVSEIVQDSNTVHSSADHGHHHSGQHHGAAHVFAGDLGASLA